MKGTAVLMIYSFTQISPGHPFGWLCDPETLARGVGYRPIQLTSQGQHGPAVKAGLSVARSCPKISMAPVLAIVWMVAGVPLQRRTARPRWEECGSFATRAGSR